MGSDKAGPKWPIAVGDCEICRNLAEEQTSFHKYGWDDMDRPLPPEAARLEPAEDVESADKESHHVKRCPICGTFYDYSSSYEYLVNGSEDEERLVRLTPTQARRFLTEEAYVSLIGALEAELTAPSAVTRGYAAKCIVSHQLDRGDLGTVRKCLEYADREIVRGALFFLRTVVRDDGAAPEMVELRPVLEELARSEDEEVAGAAGYVLRQIG